MIVQVLRLVSRLLNYESQSCWRPRTPGLGAVAADGAGEEVLGGQAQGDGGRLVHRQAAAAVEAVELAGGPMMVVVAMALQVIEMLPMMTWTTQPLSH